MITLDLVRKSGGGRKNQNLETNWELLLKQLKKEKPCHAAALNVADDDDNEEEEGFQKKRTRFPILEHHFSILEHPFLF